MFITNQDLTERDVSEEKIRRSQKILIIDQQILGVEEQKLLEV